MGNDTVKIRVTRACGHSEVYEESRSYIKGHSPGDRRNYKRRQSEKLCKDCQATRDVEVENKQETP